MEEIANIFARLDIFKQNIDNALGEKYPGRITNRNDIYKIIYPYKERNVNIDFATIQKTSYDYLHEFEIICNNYVMTVNPTIETLYSRIDNNHPYHAKLFKVIFDFMKTYNYCSYKNYEWSYNISIIYMPIFTALVKIMYGKNLNIEKNKTWMDMITSFSGMLKCVIFEENQGLLEAMGIEQDDNDLINLYHLDLIWLLVYLNIPNLVLNEFLDIKLHKEVKGPFTVIDKPFTKRIEEWKKGLNHGLFGFLYGELTYALLNPALEMKNIDDKNITDLEPKNFDQVMNITDELMYKAICANSPKSALYAKEYTTDCFYEDLDKLATRAGIYKDIPALFKV